MIKTYSVSSIEQLLGYAIIDTKQILWEFYLEEKVHMHSQEIFQYLIDMKYIVAAEYKTYDYLLMSLCHDFQKTCEGSAYLFRDYSETGCPDNRFADITIRLADMEDCDNLEVLNRMDEEVEFFHDLKEEIINQEVLVFLRENHLLGAGTFKKIWKDQSYRDIGMVVAKEHRKKGLGTFILIQLKEYCDQHDLTPVCGCWYYNFASKRTLEKAGFITKHRVIHFTF